MRVLVADSLPAGFTEALQSAGHECRVDPALTRDSLPDSLTGVEILVVRSTEVTARAIERAEALRLVVRAGSGTNTIDCTAAATAGVRVANVPGRNAIAVAELTMALLLAVDRALPDNVAALRAGQWDKRRFGRIGRGLFGRRLGIVGLGCIGFEVAVRAKAFGLELVSISNPSRPAAAVDRASDLGIVLVPDLVELAGQVDVLTLPVPLTATTANMVDARVLDALAPGILINTARPGIVVTDELLARLDSGALAAGLDVFPEEPGEGATEWRSALSMHPRVVGTHHIGASTEQAQSAVAAGVLETIEAFARGELLNVVA